MYIGGVKKVIRQDKPVRKPLLNKKNVALMSGLTGAAVLGLYAIPKLYQETAQDILPTISTPTIPTTPAPPLSFLETYSDFFFERQPEQQQQQQPQADLKVAETIVQQIAYICDSILEKIKDYVIFDAAKQIFEIVPKAVEYQYTGLKTYLASLNAAYSAGNWVNNSLAAIFGLPVIGFFYLLNPATRPPNLGIIQASLTLGFYGIKGIAHALYWVSKNLGQKTYDFLYNLFYKRKPSDKITSETPMRERDFLARMDRKEELIDKLNKTKEVSKADKKSIKAQIDLTFKNREPTEADYISLATKDFNPITPVVNKPVEYVKKSRFKTRTLY